MNYAYIKKLLDNISYKLKEIKILRQLKGKNSYKVYIVGRIKEYFFKKLDKRTDILIRRLYTNILGILLKSIRSYKYFLLVVDDATYSY